MTLNCIHIFFVTGSFSYWCVMRPASQRFFIHSCIYRRILIKYYLATFLGTISLSVRMCRKAVNQSINQFVCSISTILGINGLNSADVPLSNKQTNKISTVLGTNSLNSDDVPLGKRQTKAISAKNLSRYLTNIVTLQWVRLAWWWYIINKR